jgi:hypothetical protein
MGKLNRIIVFIAATTAFATAPLVQATEQQPQQVQQDDYSSITLMEPSTWFQNMPKPGTTMAFNPAHPAGWAQIMNPRTHTTWHMAFTNPANYAQFMQPAFYMQFMNPQNWMAWMNPASYTTFFDPNTYLYWMTPHAYIHALNPDNYMQMFNFSAYTPFFDPNSYMSWMNPAAYTVGSTPTGIVEGGAGVDLLSQWMGTFTQEQKVQ